MESPKIVGKIPIEELRKRSRNRCYLCSDDCSCCEYTLKITLKREYFSAEDWDHLRNIL